MSQNTSATWSVLLLGLGLPAVTVLPPQVITSATASVSVRESVAGLFNLKTIKPKAIYRDTCLW